MSTEATRSYSVWSRLAFIFFPLGRSLSVTVQRSSHAQKKKVSLYSAADIPGGKC